MELSWVALLFFLRGDVLKKYLVLCIVLLICLTGKESAYAASHGTVTINRTGGIASVSQNLYNADTGNVELIFSVPEGTNIQLAEVVSHESCNRFSTNMKSNLPNSSKDKYNVNANGYYTYYVFVNATMKGYVTFTATGFDSDSATLFPNFYDYSDSDKEYYSLVGESMAQQCDDNYSDSNKNTTEDSSSEPDGSLDGGTDNSNSNSSDNSCAICECSDEIKDFIQSEVGDKLDIIDGDLDQVNENLEVIDDSLDTINDSINDIADELESDDIQVDVIEVPKVELPKLEVPEEEPEPIQFEDKGDAEAPGALPGVPDVPECWDQKGMNVCAEGEMSADSEMIADKEMSPDAELTPDKEMTADKELSPDVELTPDAEFEVDDTEYPLYWESDGANDVSTDGHVRPRR